MKKLFLSLICLSFLYVTFAQTPTSGITVGLRYNDPLQVAEGYLLYSPTGGSNTYLIDRCGLKVNEWNFSANYNYTGTYLSEQGQAFKFIFNNGPGLNVSAYGDGCIEVLDWNGASEWTYCGVGDYRGMHSDLHKLPNGNYLALVQKVYYSNEMLALGANPSVLGGGDYDSEGCIEIMPTGPNSGTIVWEWDMIDHMVQDYNPNVSATYGSIAANPHKYDMNMNNGFIHFNSIDYNPDLDIIVFSSWQDDEIYMIDHSTTLAEAGGSTGGNFGKGGDLIFRWGDNANYDAPGPKRLDGQHNPRFVEEGPWVGSVSVFNNWYGSLNGGSGSGACILTPVLDTVAMEFQMGANGTYLPDNFSFAWSGDIWPGDNMFSSIESGVDFLENGNFVTCEATSGRISEITANGDVVWIYQNPTTGSGNITNQGSSSNSSDVYKIEKYSPDYPAFTGLTLTGTTPVENSNSLSTACDNIPECPSISSPLTVISSGAAGLAVSWVGVLGVTEYLVEYRESGTMAWSSSTTPNSVLLYFNLNACTEYEFRVKPLCDGTVYPSDYTPIYAFSTTGCVPDCPVSITENTQIQINSDQSAQVFIITNGTVTMGNYVQYKAGSYIELTDDFEVELGADFHAYIEGCD